MKKLFFLAVTTLFFSTSCEKYSEGGVISRSDKRISAHTWKLEKYFRDGNDETNLLVISNFLESFSEDGVITRSYIDTNGDPFSESGTWVFGNGNMKINLSSIGNIKLTDQTSTVSTSEYNIIRLKKDELWYYFVNGGSKHEFHFIKL